MSQACYCLLALSSLRESAVRVFGLLGFRGNAICGFRWVLPLFLFFFLSSLPLPPSSLGVGPGSFFSLPFVCWQDLFARARQVRRSTCIAMFSFSLLIFLPGPAPLFLPRSSLPLSLSLSFSLSLSLSLSLSPLSLACVSL